MALPLQTTILRITIIVSVLICISQAWTTKPTASARHSIRPSSSQSSTALNYRSSSYAYSSVSPTNDVDTNMRLQMALQQARDADNRHGLCTQESKRAWQIVDDIYLASSASRKVEANIKRVLRKEESIWSTVAHGKLEYAKKRLVR